MKRFTYLVAALALCAACDQRAHVGDRLPPGQMQMNNSGGIDLRNLSARVAREFDCPAGRISSVDDSASCSCNQSPYACESAGGVPCVCDPGCYDARPTIDCADYSITFSITNTSAKPIDRMTEVKLTIGDFEVSAGGLECDSAEWSLAPGETSGVIEVSLTYDVVGARFTRADLDFPCTGQQGPSDSNNSDDLGEPLPPAITSGPALLEVRGLFNDASPWMLEGSTDL